MHRKLKKTVNFFQSDIWHEDKKQNYFKKYTYKVLRILILSVQGFINDNGFDKASTLTFYTLLTIVPLLAIGFGIAQFFGFADTFAKQITNHFATQPEVAEKLIQFSNSTLKNTRGGWIASLGIFILLWTVIKTIGNVESFFNEIWEVKNPRTLWQEIKRYTPIILLFPIFLAGSSKAILFLSTHTMAASKTLDIMYLNTVLIYLFSFVSYFVSWSFLSFLYIYLPNTKVLLKSGLIAGIAIGIFFYIWQRIYVAFQVNAASYGAIYGGFAAVPLFLIWLNYSWLLVMFGAELSKNIQKELV